jgi:transcriptional regulator with XRE-family HTH domain
MNTQELLNQRLSEARSTADYSLERLLLDVNEQICSLMSKQDISRAQLADRLKVSRAWITKLLRGNRNITLKSLVDVAHELGYRADLKLVPREAAYEEEWSPRTKLDIKEAKSALKEPFAAQIREASDAFAA